MLRFMISSISINLNLTMEIVKARGTKIKNTLEKSSEIKGFMFITWGTWYKRINGPRPTKSP